MRLKWTDVREIAIELCEQYPDCDPRYVNFYELYRWICQLETFADDPQRCGEKILEAIQQCWIEEKE